MQCFMIFSLLEEDLEKLQQILLQILVQSIEIVQIQILKTIQITFKLISIMFETVVNIKNTSSLIY